MGCNKGLVVVESKIWEIMNRKKISLLRSFFDLVFVNAIELGNFLGKAAYILKLIFKPS